MRAGRRIHEFAAVLPRCRKLKAKRLEDFAENNLLRRNALKCSDRVGEPRDFIGIYVALQATEIVLDRLEGPWGGAVGVFIEREALDGCGCIRVVAHAAAETANAAPLAANESAPA